MVSNLRHFQNPFSFSARNNTEQIQIHILLKAKGMCHQKVQNNLKRNIVSIMCKYRVIQEESAILWEMIVCVILSKKVRMNMGPILNGYRDMVKSRYGPSC